MMTPQEVCLFIWLDAYSTAQRIWIEQAVQLWSTLTFKR